MLGFLFLAYVEYFQYINIFTHSLVEDPLGNIHIRLLFHTEHDIRKFMNVSIKNLIIL
jgi:hypothetical protein